MLGVRRARSALRKALLKRLLGRRYLEDYSIEERRAMWPPARALAERHIRNCRLVENRAKMLDYMPKNATCAELGIWRCEFSRTILAATEPARLHLVDIDREATAMAKEMFAPQIAQGRVEVHLGDSAGTVLSLPEAYFDWVYIDADHGYDGVKRDLEAVRQRLKPDGLIALNDYIYFGTSDFAKYGVVEAVNEFCITHDFEMVFFALHGRMYNDVAIRNIR